MSAGPKTLLTPQEYLARERRAEFKSEFYRGEMFAMAGTSEGHRLAKSNLAAEISRQLKGSGFRTVTSDLRVKVNATDFYAYPDVIVYGTPAEFDDDLRDTLLNPRAIVEVFSDETEAYDRGKKFARYRRIASLNEYVLVSLVEPLVDRYARQSNGSWLLTFLRGLDAEFAFASVPARVPLAEIYRDVEFPDAPLK